jgi:phospholipase C
MFKRYTAVCCLILICLLLSSCGGAASSTPPPGSFQLGVQATGAGGGTISSNPTGIMCGPSCTASFASGTQVTLTEVAAANSTFAGWSGACSGSKPTCSVTLSASQQVTANFSASQSAVLTVSVTGTGTGTVASSPVGIGCSPTCSASFASGTQVTLTESAAANSSFTGWSGACSGSSSTCTLTLSAAQQVTASFSAIQNAVVLTVSLAGTGTGSAASTPSGIACAPTCSASFTSGTSVTLTETPTANSTFVSWAGGCSGSSSTCGLTLNTSQQVTATFNTNPNITALTHIIFLAQENRSFDHYFGAMRQYWAQNGYPDQSFDGLPQFNPATGIAPLVGPAPAIPGCDPAYPPPDNCTVDSGSPQIASYHLITQCIENPSPSWNESHVDWDLNDQVGVSPATMNGFVWTAAHDARADSFYDVDGIRAMGYYDGSDLNYYYFMASNFATSDRWFNPAMARTQPNRAELIAGTTQGYAYPVGTDAGDKNLMTAPTIFQELQAAGITWKIYVDPVGSPCTGPPYDSACLLGLSYVQSFVWGQTIPTAYPQNIAPISQYFTDLANGTLPQVAQIEPATDAGFDEHPSNSDAVPNNIQRGANYVSSLINGLMTSTSWTNSAFILTYDEFGGLYDHVSPQPAVSPDGIKPVDLLPNDVCTGVTGPTCDFVYTGYRIPLIVISPYAKKNYVSHNVADTTAILKFIETRFSLPPLTARDAAQIDMTEFFDFTNPVWITPPSPPVQATNGACYVNQLP